MKICFAGTPAFAVPALEALLSAGHEIVGVYTQPDRPSGRGRHTHASPLKTLALLHHLPLFQPQTLRDADVQRTFLLLHPDVMVVAAYGLMLPEIFLTTPTYGCINIHASLLPRWRGAAPIHRAILAGDTETGITLMQMDAGLDTGAMLYQAACPITVCDTFHTLHDKLSHLGAECLIRTIDQLGTLQATPQNAALATYAAKVTKQEANLDWHQGAASLARAVRAFCPAYSYLHGQLVKIWVAKTSQAIAQSCDVNDAAGTILQITGESIEVATGEGILSLQKLQLAGGKMLPVSEILKARAAWFAPGSRFSAFLLNATP